jgi:hypothetical protein
LLPVFAASRRLILDVGFQPTGDQARFCVALLSHNKCHGENGELIFYASLVSAMIALVQKDRSLFAPLSPQTKFNLEATLPNVS